MAANDNHEPYFTTAWTPPVDCNGCVIRARLICSCGTNDKWWLTFSLMTSPCCDHQGSKLFGPFAQVRLALPHDCRVIALCRLWQGHRCMMWASNCRKCVWDAVSKGLSVLLTSAIGHSDTWVSPPTVPAPPSNVCRTCKMIGQMRCVLKFPDWFLQLYHVGNVIADYRV